MATTDPQPLSWRLLDRALSGALLVLGGLALFFLAALWKRRPRREVDRDERVLVSFVSINLTQALALSQPLHIVDVGGYFDEVILFGFQEGTDEVKRLEITPRISGIEWPLRPPSRLRRTAMLLSAFRCARFAARLIEERRANLVLAQDPFLRGPIALAAAALTGRLFVMHVIQDYDVSSRASQGLAFPPFGFLAVERAHERFIYKKADLLLGGWERYKDYALSKGATMEKSFALRPLPAPIHFTPPASRADCRAELGGAGRKVLLYVGRLHPVKYCSDLIEALPGIAEAHPDVLFWLVGRGPLEERLAARAEELGVADNVRFLGSKTQAQLADIYASADVAVFTHGGVALAEAALAARPIVAYEHDWHPDFIGVNERGLLARFRDTGDLARQVNRLLDDPELRARLGKRAYEYTSQAFTEELFIALQRRIYEKLFRGDIPYPR